MDKLIEGYRAFRAGRWPDERSNYPLVAMNAVFISGGIDLDSCPIVNKSIEGQSLWPARNPNGNCNLRFRPVAERRAAAKGGVVLPKSNPLTLPISVCR